MVTWFSNGWVLNWTMGNFGFVTTAYYCCSYLHVLYPTYVPYRMCWFIVPPWTPTTSGGEPYTNKTIRMDILLSLVHSMTRRHAPGSVKVHLKYGRLTLKDVKDACDALDGTPLKSSCAQVSSQQLKVASKKINAELERRAKRARWQATVSKQIMLTIWPKDCLLTIWCPSRPVTHQHFVSNLIIAGVQPTWPASML